MFLGNKRQQDISLDRRRCTTVVRGCFDEDGILPYRLARLLDWLELSRDGLQVQGYNPSSDDLQVCLLPNPFREPPEAVVSRGVGAVREYFEALLQDKHITERRDVKVVIIGEAGAGKTSLRRSIGRGKPSPTKGSEDSTVSLDVEHLPLNGTWLTVFDCAGQEAYYGLLPKFMTHRAVYLVVCDMIKFEYPSKGNGDDQLQWDVQKLEELQVLHWLRCLSWRVPGCDVILVGTKCDYLEDDIMVDIASRMEKACREYLGKWAGTNPTIRIEPRVSLTSCKAPDNPKARRESRFRVWSRMAAWVCCTRRKKEEQGWACDRGLGLNGLPTESLLHRITHKSDTGDTDAYRGISMAIPRGWNIALCALDVLDANSVPEDVAQWVLQRLGEGSAVTVRDEGATKGANSAITVESLNSKWLSVVHELHESHKIQFHNPIGALDGALTIRGYEGRILRQESQLFLDIVWLTMILKPVLNHKEETFDGNIVMDLGQGNLITLSEETDKASWRRLKNEGILEYRLAQALWPGELFEGALETLQSLDLAFPLSSGEDSDFVVMLQLREVRPEAVTEELDNFRRDGAQVLEGHWKMFLGVPPGAVEKVLTRCCRIGTTKTFWRLGVLVQGGFEGETGSTFAMCLKYVEETKMLTIQVHGDLSSVAPWVAFSYAMSAMLSMTWTFPGLKWEASMVCPSHPSGLMHVSHEARTPGQQLIEGRGCGVCNPQVKRLGVFAAGVLSVLDVNQPKDAVFSVVEERFMTAAMEHATVQNQMARNFEAFYRRMGRDLRDTLGIIGRHGAGDGDGQDGRRGGGAPTEDTRDCDPTRVPQDQCSKLDAILQQPLTNKAVIVQLLPKGFHECEEPQRDTNLTLKFVRTMMEKTRTEKYDTPRLACLLVPWDFSLPQGLSRGEQDRDNWTRRLVDDGAKKKRGWFRKNMHLFLVCADTHRLVPCGAEGHGYKIQQFRTWTKNTLGVLKVMVELTSIVLGAPVASDLSSFLIAGAEEYLGVVEDDDVSSLRTYVRDSNDGGGNQKVTKVKPLDGRSYESLRSFIHDQEDEALAEEVSNRRKAGSTRNESSSSFVYFNNEMVWRVVDNDENELEWVLRDQGGGRYTHRQGEDAPYKTKDHEPRLRLPGGGKVQGGTRQRFPEDNKPGDVPEVAEGLVSEEISSQGSPRSLRRSFKDIERSEGSHISTRRGRVDERVSPQHTSFPQENEGASGQPSSSVDIRAKPCPPPECDVLVPKIDLTARKTFFLAEEEVRLHVRPACGLEGQVAGPVSVESVCDLVFCDGHHFLVSTIVDFKPSGIRFNEPLVLDFRIGEEEEGKLSDDHASNEFDAELEEHKQNLEEKYKVLWRKNSDDPWELVDKETVDVLHESGKFFVRAQIHHFSQNGLATNVGTQNMYYQEVVRWRRWSRPGGREIQVLNATDRALVILAWPNGFSNMVVNNRRVGFEGHGFGANMHVTRAADQAIFSVRPQMFQLGMKHETKSRWGEKCPSDYFVLSQWTPDEAIVVISTADDEEVIIWDHKIIRGGTRLMVLPGRFSGIRPSHGTFKRRDLPGRTSVFLAVVEAVKKSDLIPQDNEPFVSRVSTTGAVQSEPQES